MPIRSAPCYWVECDGDGCDSRVPPADSDVTAWSDLEGAAAHAYDNGWLARGGSWLCLRCRPLLDEDDDDLAEGQAKASQMVSLRRRVRAALDDEDGDE